MATPVAPLTKKQEKGLKPSTKLKEGSQKEEKGESKKKEVAEIRSGAEKREPGQMGFEARKQKYLSSKKDSGY